MSSDVEGCLACDVAHGRRPVPGGLLATTPLWAVTHCVGPLPLGTLIVAPARHCLGVDALTPAEADELGPLLRRATAAVRRLVAPDQVYACLWSHAGWEPGHVHFVLQPAWNAQAEEHAGPGPALQAAQFAAGVLPDPAEVEALAVRARELLA